MTYRLLLTIQAGEAWEPSKSNGLSAVGKHVTEENLQFVWSAKETGTAQDAPTINRVRPLQLCSNCTCTGDTVVSGT